MDVIVDVIEKFNFYLLIASLFGVSFTTTTLADEMRPYIAGEFEMGTATFGNSTPSITYSNGRLIDTYPLDNASSKTNSLSLHGGYEFKGHNWRPAFSVGLGFYNTVAPYTNTGTLIETIQGSAGSTLYYYKLKVASQRLLIEPKLTWQLTPHIAPFVDGGFGLSANEASGYEETAASSNGTVLLPAFQLKINRGMAYQLGFGMSYLFNFKPFAADAFQHERIGIGYRWVDLGKAQFAARGVSYPYSLDLGELTEQAAYLNFTHLF